MFPSAYIVISLAINICSFAESVPFFFLNKTRIEWRLDLLKVPIHELFHRCVQKHTEAPQHY